jgi:hypothetical protein
MLTHSEKLDQIGPAILAVQKIVGGVEANADNPHFKSKYADLASTNAAIRSHLLDNGVAITQWPGIYDAEGKTMEMTTMLLHAESGQWMRGSMSVPLSRSDAQGYGSCLTYARRYALQSALDLSPEDDDGETASQKQQPTQRQQSQPQQSKEEIEKIARANYDEAIRLIQGATTVAELDQHGPIDKAIKWSAIPKGWHPRIHKARTDHIEAISHHKTNAAVPPDFSGMDDDIPF